jgi:hypothetical protein
MIRAQHSIMIHASNTRVAHGGGSEWMVRCNKTSHLAPRMPMTAGKQAIATQQKIFIAKKEDESVEVFRITEFAIIQFPSQSKLLLLYIHNFSQIRQSVPLCGTLCGGVATKPDLIRPIACPLVKFASCTVIYVLQMIRLWVLGRGEAYPCFGGWKESPQLRAWRYLLSAPSGDRQAQRIWAAIAARIWKSGSPNLKRRPRARETGWFR